MKILITGASGFLGSKVLSVLLRKGHIIAIILRRDLEFNEVLIKNIEHDHLHVLYTYNSDWKISVTKFQPDAVIHFAALLSGSDSEEQIIKLLESNISFGCQLLDALKFTDIKYFINTGTSAEYKNSEICPNPSNFYAASKTAFRSFLQYYQNLKGFKVINIIPYTIYGYPDSQKKLIDYIYSSLGAGAAINMSPGEQVLDFIHLDDLVGFYDQLILSLENFQDSYAELHVGTSVGSSPKKIATIMEKITNKTANINWGGLDYRAADSIFSVADIMKSKEMTNWMPSISIETGIGMYIKNMNDNGI